MIAFSFAMRKAKWLNANAINWRSFLLQKKQCSAATSGSDRAEDTRLVAMPTAR
ncbi:MAG: hypothetical protein ACYC5H_09710 [Methylovirgula sp.]